MPPTVLIVDDSATMRNALKVYLRDCGLSFAEAETAERALALVRLLRPALALVDLNLPGMTGIEFVQRLRGEPTTAQMPVLLVTGEEPGEWSDRGLAAGANGFIRKPVDAALLRTRVLELLPPRST
jgi:CheY-like chemotaxis protein